MDNKFEFEWISKNLTDSNRGALLIPFYNEASDEEYFIKRLNYYNNLAEKNKDIIDVILINDGSSDNSLEILRKYSDDNEMKMSLSSIWPNGKKVGAQDEATKRISHDNIIYSDFDTDLLHLEHLPETFDRLDADPKLMGCYFKMYPEDKPKIAVKFQQLEYTLARINYKKGEEDNSVAVIPGAGCIYKKKVIEEIFKQHSRKVSGEDRETAMIGQALGYGAFYQKKIHVVTRVPEKYSVLIKQRVRWTLGFMENFVDKKGIFFKQLLSKKNISSFSMDEVMSVFKWIMMPIIILWTVIWPNFIGPALLLYIYINDYFGILLQLKRGKDELPAGSSMLWFSTIGHVMIHYFVVVPSSWGALLKLIKNKILRK